MFLCCAGCKNVLYGWTNENGVESKLPIYHMSDHIPNLSYIYCGNCERHIGLKFEKICIKCFGEEDVPDEKILDWIPRFRKNASLITQNNKCGICLLKNFKYQYWYYNDEVFFQK